MRGRYGVIFAVLGFIVFFAIEALAADWVLYGTSTDGSSHYYDPQSIKWVSQDIVRVWKKMSFSKKGVQDMPKKNGPEHKEWNYTIGLWEYSCSEKKFRLLSATNYNQGGGVISSFTYDSSSWDFIVPESIDETLFNIVCGSR